MKKSVIITAIFTASAILLAASCQKQEQPEPKTEGKTFTAVIAQELTKTTITSEYKVNWEDGDQIDINGATFSATPKSSDATRASFTKVSGSDPAPDYTAVYPASIVVNTVPTLPATQTYAAGKFNAPMCAMSDSETLEFKNICGVLCFALKGTDKVRSIAVTASEQLCGPFEFMDATSFCFTGENKGYTVTLDCGTEGIQLDETTATNFYIYLPPCTYTAGMKMTVTNTDGQVFEKTTTKSAGIARSNVYTFNWTPSFAPLLPAGALSGKFSVSATKKVYFSQGNLYWDGSAFNFETNQYDCKTSWDASHVSLFQWSKTASVAYAETYNDASATATDVFFTNDPTDEGKAKSDFTVNSVTGQYRTLTEAEWQYLFSHDGTEGGWKREGTDYRNEIRRDKYKLGVTVCGKTNSVILLPDDWKWGGAVGEGWQNGGYSETTDVKWSAMEAAGAVCLPEAGFREGTSGWWSGWQYWTSSHDTGDYKPQNYAFRTCCYDGSIEFDFISSEGRYQGVAVRLVIDEPVE